MVRDVFRGGLTPQEAEQLIGLLMGVVLLDPGPLARVEALFRETERLDRLYKPLIEKLLPIAYELDLADAPQGRRIRLPKSDWADQHEAGIDMCVGLRIEWV